MSSKLISVPFKAEQGLSEYNGIAKFSPAGIILEFEGKLFGLVGGEIKEVRVALDQILDVRFRKGFLKFFAQIQLRLKDFTKLSKLPNDSGKVKLKIKREDFELARRAVEQMEAFLNGEEIDKLIEDGRDELPPAPTSVNELFDTEKLKTNDLNKTNKLK